MPSLRMVLVGIDFSPASAAALAHARRLADFSGGAVRCLHVVEPFVFMPPDFPMWAFPAPVDQSQVEDARRAFPDFAKRALNSAEPPPFDVVVGTPAFELHRRAASADLLALGAHAGSTPGAGPVAASCVRHAHCRVLLCRHDHAGPFRRVLACVDFSPTSLRALEDATRLAARDSAALDILHVYRSPFESMPGRDEFLRNMPDAPHQYEKAIRDRLAAFAQPLAAELAYLKPQFHALASTSHGKGIASFITAHDCDLVVLGVRGSTNLRDVLIGSTAERVLRDAPCSILTVRPD